MKKYFLNKKFVFGAIIVIIFIILGLFSNFIMPHDPYKVKSEERLKPPNLNFLLGTDDLGRDILSRIILGARTTLFVVFSSVMLSILIGVSLGLISGFYGGLIDTVIMRLQDGILAFPVVLLAILIMSTVEAGFATLIFTIGIYYVPAFARLVRAKASVIKNSEFVKASIVEGGNNFYLIFRLILPNCLSVILIRTVISLAVAILIESSFSYLGLGIQPPTPSWGLMLKDAQSYLSQAPWYVFAPGLCIIIIVFGFSLLGDAIQEVTSPRL